MNGPVNKPKRKIGFGVGKLEFASAFFGLIVVLGLVLELGSEVKHVIATRVWPSRELIGGALVAVGVFGEVALGIFIARESKRSQMDADERIALAERATAEANLARAKIEQRMRPRVLSVIDHTELGNLLASCPRMGIDIIVFDHHNPETLFFAEQITSVFASAGWRVRLWESRKVTYRIPGPSVLVALAVGHIKKEFLDFAEKFAGALTALDIDCGVSAGTFGCEGEFSPGAFELRFQKPTVQMGVPGVAPVRIQIGAKQLSPVLPSKIVRLEPKA